MKIGFLITARLKSTRLPFKILKDLAGKTVVERIIDRAKEVENISKVVLCTSVNPQDKPLIDIAKRNDIYCFTGDEDDVLKRLLDAAKLFGLDYFVSITADNPLFSVRYANLITEIFKKHNSDFIRIHDLPLGGAPYGLKTKALEVVCKIKHIVDTEFWRYFFEKPDIFNAKHVKIKGKLKRPDLRLTLDYSEDYDVIRNIYSNINFNKVLGLRKAVDYLNKNPEIAKINQNQIQLNLNEEIKNKIDSIYSKKIKEIRKLKNKIYKKQSKKI